jgi:hypothetical protein
VFTSAERPRVNIRRIEGSYCAHLGMKARPDGKMSPQTDPVASDATGAAFLLTKKLHRHVGILIVGSKLLCVLQFVAPRGTGLVVCEHRSKRLKFMINLRNRDDIAVAAQGRSHSTDRVGDLKDLRIEDNTRMAARRLRHEEMHAHGSTRG